MTLNYRNPTIGEGPAEDPVLIVINTKDWMSDLYQRMLSRNTMPREVEEFIISFASNFGIVSDTYKFDVQSLLRRMDGNGIDCAIIYPYIVKLMSEILKTAKSLTDGSPIKYIEIELAALDKYTTAFLAVNIETME